LQRVRQAWDVEIADVPSAVVFKASLSKISLPNTSLPLKPKVLVLPGL
jgi:hypothetical protein